MFKLLLGKMWRKLPVWARRALVRATQPSFTVSAGVVVVNDANEILLLDHVLRPASGWGIPGGFLEANEQPADAAQREIWEETKLQIKDLRFVEARTFERHVEFIFFARANGAPDADSPEILEARWFALDELPARLSRKDRGTIRRAISVGENAGLSYPVGN